MSHSQKVFVAGATGYLGSKVVAELKRRGRYVVALSRKMREDIVCDKVFVGDPTKPDNLKGCMEGVGLVVSCLGITRQRDGLTYNDVDYQANMNLLSEAKSSGVPHFAYVHVLHGDDDDMQHVEMVQAKQKFAAELRNSKDIKSTIICPSGFFSDMKDFLDMAKSGRAWLFGDGGFKINPIHGADLALALADAIESGAKEVNIGGPEVFTHKQLAELAFECHGTDPRISFLWDSIRVMALSIVTWVAPLHIRGPAQFFLTAFGKDMVGDTHGTIKLKDHWLEILAQS